MNREILFRAWDKESKRMFNWNQMKTGYLQGFFDGRYGELMQYTGICDKNGRKIFEGDVVLATLRYFNIVNEKCKVIFHNGSFGVQYGFSAEYFKSFAAWDEIEVIGSIHDNPELLEVEK